jgi:hypothetical protein
MFDPHTSPPLPETSNKKAALSQALNVLGWLFIVVAMLWTWAWLSDASRRIGDGPPWSGPPVFGYGLLCLILAKLHKPPAK